MGQTGAVRRCGRGPNVAPRNVASALPVLQCAEWLERSREVRRSVVEPSLNANPYQSPPISSDTPHASPSDGSLSRGSNHAVLRFVLVTFISATIVFAFWCVLDYVTVRVLPYPDRVRDFDWIAFGFPVLPFVVARLAWRSEPWERRLSLSVASTVVACLLAGTLIVMLGIPFHFSIGGDL